MDDQLAYVGRRLDDLDAQIVDPSRVASGLSAGASQVEAAVSRLQRGLTTCGRSSNV